MKPFTIEEAAKLRDLLVDHAQSHAQDRLGGWCANACYTDALQGAINQIIEDREKSLMVFVYSLNGNRVKTFYEETDREGDVQRFAVMYPKSIYFFADLTTEDV